MYTFPSALLFSFLMVASANVLAADFPKAPANQKEAEAEGLQRVSLEELRNFIPGTLKSKGFKGAKHTLTFKSDGSVDRTGFGDKEQTGKWNFDEGKNAYCLAFQEKKGYQKNCFAVFRAKDGINFFDYDEGNGFYAHVWHPGE